MPQVVPTKKGKCSIENDQFAEAPASKRIYSNKKGRMNEMRPNSIFLR